MSNYYGTKEYKADLIEAGKKYERCIRRYCTMKVGGETIIKPIDDTLIYEAKRKARAYRNQHIGASGKRLRASIALQLIDDLKVEGWDLTVTLAVRITKKLLGRAINRKVLLDYYASENRTASCKSIDFEKLETIEKTESYNKAKKTLQATLEEARILREAEAEVFKNSKAFKLLSDSAKLGRQKNL